MNGYSDRLKMIEYLYQVAVDPLCYDDLLKHWDKVIHTSIANGDDSLKDQDLALHVDRASAILERLETSGDRPVTLPLAQTIEIDPNPAVLISREGIIISANGVAIKQLGLRVGARILSTTKDTNTSGGKTKLLLDKFADTSTNEEGIFGLIDINSLNDERVLLALTHVQCQSDDRVSGLLSCLAPMWSKQSISVLRLHFNLTSAEIEVVQELVANGSVTQIAQTRKTSIHTVRSQIKSILLKANMESQIDLIRHIGFLQRFEKAPRDSIVTNAANDPDTTRSIQCSLTLSDGRNMEFSKTGPSGGAPTLYIHGMVDSPHFAPTNIEQLYQRNILLIAPSRPGFGKSDPISDATKLQQTFASDAIELLNHLTLHQVPILAHMAGTVYAYGLAGSYPDRISSILGVSGTVPIISRQQIMNMSPSHRLVGLTAMHSPKLLPMFTKAGIALIRIGREEILLNSAFKNSPLDMELASRPEIRALIYQRYHFLSRQGHWAFQNDSIQVSSDWSALMDKIICPVTLVHGAHDQVVQIELVREFSNRFPTIELIETNKSGQLVLSNEPALVFDQLDQLINGSTYEHSSAVVK